MKITVVGIGYVGLANAILLAQNHSVTLIDIISDKVDLTALDGTHTCSNNVSAGTATCGSGALNFDYGTGAYTFDNVIIDKDASKLKWDGCGLYHKQSITKNLRFLKYL